MKAQIYTIGSLEISIKCRDKMMNDKYNDRDTMYAMNLLSILLDDDSQLHKAAYDHRPDMECFRKMSELRKAEAREIYEQLEALGLYKEGENDNVEE